LDPTLVGQQQILHFILIMRPPPRKSLVKGERFIRSEGRPEYSQTLRDHFYTSIRKLRLWVLNT